MLPSEMLRIHGTPDALPPGAIAMAARSDIDLKLRKRDDPYVVARHYAFHRRHVALAVDAADLIRLALDHPGIGVSSGKYNTRLIYSNEGKLRQALEMVMVGMAA